MKDNRVQCCEELGEQIMPSNIGMVLSIYLRTSCHSTINCVVQCEDYDRIVPYATSVGLKMDNVSIFSQLLFIN